MTSVPGGVVKFVSYTCISTSHSKRNLTLHFPFEMAAMRKFLKQCQKVVKIVRNFVKRSGYALVPFSQVGDTARNELPLLVPVLGHSIVSAIPRVWLHCCCSSTISGRSEPIS